MDNAIKNFQILIKDVFCLAHWKTKYIYVQIIIKKYFVLNETLHELDIFNK